MNRSILFFLSFFGRKEKKNSGFCSTLTVGVSSLIHRVCRSRRRARLRQDNEPERTRLYTQALTYTDTHTKRERTKKEPIGPIFSQFSGRVEGIQLPSLSTRCIQWRPHLLRTRFAYGLMHFTLPNCVCKSTVNK